MSGPIRPEPADPLDELMAMKQQSSAPDPLDELMKLKQPHDYHAEFKSGALQKRMAGANARDAANLADEQASQPGYLERFATHALNAAQGIPGVEAVEAGAGALKSAGSANLATPAGRAAFGQAYRTSLDNLHGATKQIGGKTAAAERVMGSVATLPFLAANPVVAGAQLGGADQALSAAPNESLAVRAMKTAGGAAIGAVTGKVAEFLPTAARAVFAKAPDANIFARQAARAASAKTLYDQSVSAGMGREPTPAVLKFLAEPDVAPIVEELQQSRPLQGVEAHDPRMLDAIYKTFSDRVKQLQRGLDATNPTRPNIGRFRLRDAKAAQQQLLSAMEAPGTVGGTEVAAQEAAPVASETLRARTDGGRLKSFAKVSDEELAGEYASLVDANAMENTAPSSLEADGGAYQWVGQKTGAMHAEGRIAQRKLSIAKVEQELQRRGIKPEDAYWLGKPGDAAEAALSHPDNAVGDTSFNFGENLKTPVRSIPPMMPTYRDAVTDFANKSAGIQALKQGFASLRSNVNSGLPSVANLTRTTPEALSQASGTMSEPERDALGEGVMGGVKMLLKKKPLTEGRRAVSIAPSIMRAANVPDQELSDFLSRLLLTSGNAYGQP